MDTYILDTNVLLCDGLVIKKISDAKVIIPVGVLRELDRHKNDPGEVGLNARKAIRHLDEIRQEGKLTDGVTMSGNVTVMVDVCPYDSKEVDAHVIQVACLHQKDGEQVTILSNDINLRLLADIKGVNAVAYGTEHFDGAATEEDVYSGIRHGIIDSEVINELHKEGVVEEIPHLDHLVPHGFLHLRAHKDEKHTGVGRLHEDGRLHKISEVDQVFGIKYKNLEQACAIDALVDTNVPLVTLMGKAGTGKTLIALASALHLVCKTGEYNKVMVIRPPIPMGNDLGYLPGDLDEKMEVWAQPVLDALGVALSANNSKYGYEYLVQNGLLEIIPPTYIRGRTLSRCVVLIDEAQGLSRHEIKTIVTRLGEDSKLIVTGDIHQIDNPQLSATDNGFTHLIEKFREEPLSAHIKLTKCERSDLASRAAEIL